VLPLGYKFICLGCGVGTPLSCSIDLTRMKPTTHSRFIECFDAGCDGEGGLCDINRNSNSDDTKVALHLIFVHNLLQFYYVNTITIHLIDYLLYPLK
jgi:hypothetical protein